MDSAPLSRLSKRLRADSFRIWAHFFWLEFDSGAFQGFVERFHRESEGRRIRLARPPRKRDSPLQVPGD